MADTWRQDAIVQAIQIIADKKIAQAGYDKTYKGIVNKVLDKTTGKYEIKYQDSLIEAYATSSEIYFEEGQQISFLVPGNDWDRIKTIIGGIENTALTYNQVQEISEKYNKTGPSVVHGQYALSSYKYNYVDITDTLNIDEQIINNYVKNSNGLVLGMNVQTSLASSQVGGEYGLIFNLEFKDNVTGEITERQYVVNSKDVIGNPFAVTKQTSVERLFEDVDLENINGIKSVYVYCENFPYDTEKAASINDIFISNIRLNGVDVLTQDDLSGYSVHIDYSQTGYILKSEEVSQTGEIISDEISVVTLKGILKVKGKIISSDVDYYWFRQNGMVLREHEKYSSYGGDGWECLNYFVNGKAVPFTENAISFTSVYNSENPVSAIDKNTRVKCVAVFKHKSTEGFCNVLNKIATTNVYIDSDEKKQGTNNNKVDYYLDAGHPTLTCKADPNDSYDYHWTIVPARGKAESRESSQVDRSLYIDRKAKWDKVENYAKSLAVADAEKYRKTTEYTDAKENFKQVQFAPYVYKNVYYNFPINTISDYTKIICTITKYNSQIKKDEYKGSASITLYNHMQVPDTYNLNIENGTQVFQYDGKGNSPASPQLEKPLQILPLTFTLIDDEGNQISYDQIVNNGYVEWMIPKNNTLLISKGNDQSKKINYDTAIGTDRALAADFDIYKNIPSFSYTIAPVYDSKLTKNYIRLDIKYKDMLFSAYTDFTFPKDGDPGTNGTDYVAKLIPAIQKEKEDGTKEIINLQTDRVYVDSRGFKYTDDGNEFDRLIFLLYNNSRLVDNTVNFWTCPPKTTYKEGKADINGANHYINVDNSGVISKNSGITPGINSFSSQLPVDIVRAQKGTENDIKYFAQYPICFNYLNGDANEGYRFKIKPKTGFKYVIYTEDGTLPNYDKTLPFEIIVQKKDDDSNYYIIQDTNDLRYEWYPLGQIEIDNNLNKENGITEFTKGTLTTNYKTYLKPVDKFISSDITNAIVIKIKKGNSYIGWIHVPIYMIINRYGHSAINSWDGTSIQMKEGGDIILAPQVGAGKKNDDNQFTGVLIGDVKSGNKSEQGLFGYHQGQRSIFLDANTGNATFGVSGEGQIKLIPGGTSTIANWKINQNTLQGGNITLNKDGYIDVNYSTSSNPQTGIRIDGRTTSDKVITTGSGNFSVSRERGYLTAKGGGSVASWDIHDDKLTSKNNSITLLATNGSIYSGTHNSLTANNNGYYIGSDGISLGNTTDYVKFRVTSDGKLTAKSGDIAGWTIEQGKLSNTDAANNKLSLSPTAGISIVNGTDNSKKFTVNNQGYLTSTSGKIGGWNITSDKLWAVSENGKNGIQINSDGSLTGGSSSNNTTWNTDSEGRKTSLGGGGSWAIKSDGSSTFKNITANYLKASNVDVEGDLYANYIKADSSGTIGGWQISQTQLTGGNLILNSSGSMSGPGWSIDSNGNAKFANSQGTFSAGGGSSVNGGFSCGASGGGSWGGPAAKMEAKTITLHTKLGLARVSSGSHAKWHIPTEITSFTAPSGIKEKDRVFKMIQGDISGQTSEGDSVSGTCTIYIPVYELDYTGGNSYNTIGSSTDIGTTIVTGWSPGTTTQTFDFLCSSNPNQSTQEDS